MIAPQQDNARAFRFQIAAPPLGVALLAQVTHLFVKPGVWHQHLDEVQMLFALSGRVELAIDEQTWRLEPGSRIVVPTGRSHRAMPLAGHERVEFIDLRVVMSSATPLSQYIAALPAGVETVDPKPIRAIADGLAAHLEAGRIATTFEPGQATLTAAVWSLLALYETSSSDAGAGPELPASGGEDSRLRYAEVLMRDHLEDPLPIETLAARVNLSSSRLRQLMLQQYGVPPQERYLQLRLEKARLYVESSTLTMKEIARSCGFSTADYFSRAFSAWAGATPTQVRRQAQDKLG